MPSLCSSPPASGLSPARRSDLPNQLYRKLRLNSLWIPWFVVGTEKEGFLRLKAVRKKRSNLRAVQTQLWHFCQAMLSCFGSPVRYFSALCASPFFPMTQPPALGVVQRQPELGACILDACALKTQWVSSKNTMKNTKNKRVRTPLVGGRLATGRWGSQPRQGPKSPKKCPISRNYCNIWV